VVIDDQELTGSPVLSDRSWVSHFEKNKDGKWAHVQVRGQGITQAAWLQGPIDDAFMSSF